MKHLLRWIELWDETIIVPLSVNNGIISPRRFEISRTIIRSQFVNVHFLTVSEIIILKYDKNGREIHRRNSKTG